MNYLTIIAIAIGLAMDAFSVSLVNGTLKNKIEILYSLKISLCFGFFQFFMTLLGILIGNIGEKFIYNISHWIAFSLLLYIGTSMIHDSIKSKKIKEPINFKPLSTVTLIFMAIATSIDALATGVILPYTLNVRSIASIIISISIIGIITFILSLIGVFLGCKFGSFFSSKSTIIGGCILIIIGFKILIEHYI